MKSIFLAIVVLPLLLPLAAAANFEISAGFNYNRTNYGDNSYSWTKRWGGSIGYYFFDRSQIEIAYNTSVDRTVIAGYEDTTFIDEVMSLNWVQSLLARDSPIQPYVKTGVGQLNRSATGSYWTGASPPTKFGSLTGVVGAGSRLFFTRNLGLRVEGVTYLSGASIRTWRDNVSVTFGLSWYF